MGNGNLQLKSEPGLCAFGLGSANTRVLNLKQTEKATIGYSKRSGCVWSKCTFRYNCAPFAVAAQSLLIKMQLTFFFICISIKDAFIPLGKRSESCCESQSHSTLTPFCCLYFCCHVRGLADPFIHPGLS